MSEQYRIWGQTDLPTSSLVVAWNRDMSQLGNSIADYLIGKLGGQNLAEIEPVDFFPLGGVTVEDNLVQFPESKFYLCQTAPVLVFISDPPSNKWYEFLSLVLEVAQQCCRVKEVYTIGGLVSVTAHTAPRGLVSTFSSPEFKAELGQYNLASEMDYETPPEQRPTLNSFLLWTARRKNIPGVSLWAPIPFYLLGVGDSQTQRRVLEFFNQRFDLSLDFNDIDNQVRAQNEKLARLRTEYPEIDGLIAKLESNQPLSDEENEKLAKQVQESIKGTASD